MINGKDNQARIKPTVSIEGRELTLAYDKLINQHLQYSALIKAIKNVHWLACENVPLSKFVSMMDFLKDKGTPGLHF